MQMQLQSDLTKEFRQHDEVHQFCYESSSNTTTTVTFHSIPSVLPNYVIPGWMQSVHASHGMILVGGVAGCLRCGSIVSTRTPKLMKICEGRFKPDNKHRCQTLARGGCLENSHSGQTVGNIQTTCAQLTCYGIRVRNGSGTLRWRSMCLRKLDGGGSPQRVHGGGHLGTHTQK